MFSLHLKARFNVAEVPIEIALRTRTVTQSQPVDGMHGPRHCWARVTSDLKIKLQFEVCSIILTVIHDLQNYLVVISEIVETHLLARLLL